MTACEPVTISQNQIQEKHRKIENSQTQHSDTQTSNNIPQWAEHILDFL